MKNIYTTKLILPLNLIQSTPNSSVTKYVTGCWKCYGPNIWKLV